MRKPLCRGLAVIPRSVTHPRIRRARRTILPWLPTVRVRPASFWDPVRLWYDWQHANLGAVQVYGERVPCRLGAPHWQWPPGGFRQPVWGWRGVVVALWTRRWLRRQGRAGWVDRQTYGLLRIVLTARRRWSAALTRRVEGAVRDVAVRRERKAKPMTLTLREGGIGVGWRR